MNEVGAGHGARPLDVGIQTACRAVVVVVLRQDGCLVRAEQDEAYTLMAELVGAKDR